jgi:hypothetical protein
LRSRATLLGKALLSWRAARSLLAELFGLALSTGTCATWAALSGSTLLELLIATGALLAELLGLALPTGAALAAAWSAPLASWSSSALSALLELLIPARALLAELLRLALATWTLTGTALTRSTLAWSTLATLLSLLELRTTLAWSAKLFRLPRLSTLLAALATLLTSLSSRTGALAGRLAALLGLSARLPLVLAFVLILGVLALRDDQLAVGSAHALKRDAQLRSRNRGHQGAGEQDIAKLSQLLHRFEWQVALLRIGERRIAPMRSSRPDCGTSSAPLRPDFGSRLNGFQ